MRGATLGRGLLVAGLGLLCAQVAVAQPKPAPSPSPGQVQTTAAQRSSLSLTIYNDGRGLVRETRKTEFPAAGAYQVDFTDVSPQILAPSVALRMTGTAKAPRILEQIYRYDVLSPAQLAQKADGTGISLYRYHPGTGEDRKVQGTALAGFEAEQTPVVQTQEGITYYTDYHALGFSQLPAQWSSRPSLRWKLQVPQPGPQSLEVSYLTQGMRWAADYVWVLGPGERPGALLGWITLINESGASYDQAHLSVVAGKVHQVFEGRLSTGMGGRAYKSDKAGADVERSALSEYYLYDLGQTTDLPDRSSKQVSFVSTDKIQAQMAYVIDHRSGDDLAYSLRGATDAESPQIEYRFQNKLEQGLGAPLPEGTVRIFVPDSLGHLQFIGQSALGHTPRDEAVKLRVGRANDMVLHRNVMGIARMGRQVIRQVQYRMRNGSPRPVTVDIYERMGTVKDASIAHETPDASTTLYRVQVPVGGETSWQATYILEDDNQ